MTIQLSVLIWTVICFVLLMLIVSKMLFKPMLEFMDKRNARIEHAKQRRQENEKLAAEQMAVNEAARAEAERKNALLLRSAVENARTEAAALITSAQHESTNRRERYREELRAEAIELNEQLDAKAKALAELFAERVVSGR